MHGMKITEKEFALRSAILCEKLGLVRKYAAICGVPPEHQEDVVQEAMIAAYQHLDQLRDLEHFDGWLFRITKRKAGHFFAAQKRRMSREINLEEWLEIGNEPEAYLAWKAAEERIDDARLLAMVESLRPPAPAIIRMRFAMGFSLKEVAEMLEMNYNTVKTIERRAFGKLKDMIIREEALK